MTTERGKLLYGITVPTSAGLLRGQLEWLAQRGWEVHLVTSSGHEIAEISSREGVHLHIIEMEREPSPFKDLKALLAWLKLLRRIRPDVINLGTPKASLLGGLAGWLTRVPRRVAVVWGLRFEGFQGWRRRLFWAFEKLTMATATHVVPISASLLRVIREERLAAPKRIWPVIGAGSSNGVAADTIAAAAEGRRAPVRASLGIADDTFVVGFVGRLVHDKGVPTLIAALRDQRLASRDVVCLVLGNEEEGGLADDLRAAGNVVWAGYVDEPWGHLAAMDVLVLPTLREGFPNVVLEAASAGVATITTRATGAVDSVVDGTTGLLIDVGDAVALADAIVRLLDDEHERRRMGEAARQRARSEFAPERIWRGLDELYVS